MTDPIEALGCIIVGAVILLSLAALGLLALAYFH